MMKGGDAMMEKTAKRPDTALHTAHVPSSGMARHAAGSVGASIASGRRKLPHKRLVLVLSLCLAAVLGTAGVGYAVNVMPDYSWYTANPSASEFTITTAGQMQAFSSLVNGTAVDSSGKAIAAESFAGKTVALGGNINLMGQSFTSIGTSDHPFAGIFSGNGKEIRGLNISWTATGSTASANGIGLFGHASSTSVIKDVSLNDSCKVSVSSDGAVIGAVGSLVGDCEGTLANCSSAAAVAIAHSATSVSSAVVCDVGGLAGTVKGAVSSCSYSGALRASTPANAYASPTDKDTTVSTVADNVGGVVGSVYSDVEGCSNSGSVIVITSGSGGLDRFGSNVDSNCRYVGGVAGYGEGNVDGCTNSGTLFTTAVVNATLADIGSAASQQSDGGADGMGGIIGSLRGVTLSGLNSTGGDLGMGYHASALTLSNCSNTGYVSGLHTVGGIVGVAGTNTTITRCTNGGYDDHGNVTGDIRTTRWNKPAGGGVAGQSYGAISYCRNEAEVNNTKSGYYTAGIVGMLVKWDTQPQIPEVYACYNTGNVYVGTSLGAAAAAFREGGIVGENNGYIHDNVFLAGTVSAQLSAHTSADDVAAGVNLGTVADSTVVYDSDAVAKKNGGTSLKSGQAVAILNKLAANGGWSSYYFIADGVNKGYPVLNGEAAPASTIDLSKVACSIDFVQNAAYTAAYNPTPSLKVSITVDGQTKELIEGSDYKVVADPSALNANGTCLGVTNGAKPYKARIEGIGNYYGMPDVQTSYGIDKGAFSSCTVSVVGAAWTGAAQNQPVVTVVDAGGSLVAASNYSIEVNSGKDCVDKGSYLVKATASAASNYTGSTSGTYAITTVDLYKNADVVGVYLGNRVWYYDEEKNNIYEVKPILDANGQLQRDDQNLIKVEGMSTYVSSDGRTLTKATPKNTDPQGKPVYGGLEADFTGDTIKPQCIGVLYNGKLLNGCDESQLTTDNADKMDYVLQYGYSGDRTPRLAPRNTNAGDASIVIGGNAAGTFSNYVYIGFTICPIAIDASDLTVTTKSNPTRNYANGSAPDIPAKTYSGSASDLFPSGTFYRDDELVVTYNGHIVDATNYDLQFDYTTDASDQKTDSPNFAVGNHIYYKIMPTANASLTGYEKHISNSYWRIDDTSGKMSVAESAIVKNVSDLQYDPFNASAYYPTVALTDTTVSPHASLVQNSDYTLNWGSSKFSATLHLDANGRPSTVLSISGTGDKYVGSLDVPVSLQKAVIEPSQISSLSNYAWHFCDGTTGSSSTGPATLPYKVQGYSKSEISAYLMLSWTDSVSEGFPPEFPHESGFIVDKITDANGVDVDRIANFGENYTLTFHKDNSKSVFLDINGSCQITTNMSMYKSGFVFNSGDPLGVTMLSGAQVEPASYMYTGDIIAPTLQVFDADGNSIDSSYFVPVPIKEIKEPGEYNGTPDASGYVRDYVWTGDGVHYAQYLKASSSARKINKPSDTVKLKFSVVAADISDTKQVKIAVDEARYNNGNAVTPKVTFYDATTGKQLNYQEGSDYSLSYSNNKEVASATDAIHPAVTITVANPTHLISNAKDANGDYTVSAPFTIEGSGVQAGDADWDYAKTIAVGQDGKVSSPGVVGSYQGKSFTADEYSATVGTYDPATQVFTAKTDGWSAGDKAYYLIKGTKVGVCEGSTVVGPLDVVGATDAITFKAGSATLNATSGDTVFTGLVATPHVVATDGGTILKEGRDYSLACANANAGAATVTVSGLGAYCGSMDVGFTINPADLASVDAKVESQTYTGSQLTPAASAVTDIKLGSFELASNDWTVKADGYGPNVDVANKGSMIIIPGSSGNFTGSKTASFDITPTPLVSSELSIKASDATYSGKAIVLDASTLKLTDIKRSKDLVLNQDYTIAGYANNVNAGTATVYITGAGNYSATANTVTSSFAIKPLSLSKDMISGIDGNYEFDGKALQPTPKVAVGDTSLPSTDYTVAYGQNTVPGTAKGSVTITPSGSNLTGAAVVQSFDITADLNSATIEAIPNGTYMRGGSYEPTVTVMLNGTLLENGTDYNVSYDTDGNAGQKTLTVTGVAPYTGTKTIRYAVDGKSLSECSAGSISDQAYTGLSVQPGTSVTDGDYTLVPGTDYDVSFAANVAASDKAEAILSGKGNYAGVITKTFAIRAKNLASPGITALATAKSTFTGSGAVEANTFLKDTGIQDADGHAYVLVEGKDYSVAYSNNNGVGSATAAITGLGNYAGSLSETYAVKADMASATIQPIASLSYTGVALQPAPLVKLGSSTLVAGTDYTVSYTDNTKPGMATVLISGIGNYIGNASAGFVITMPEMKDTSTGVKVSGTGLVDAADGGTIDMSVNSLPQGSALMQTLKQQFATDDTDVFLGYSIVLQRTQGSATGNLIDGFGYLTVELPVGDAYNGRSAMVVIRHTAADGTVSLEIRTVVIEHGVAVVQVDKLSDFFVAVSKAASPAAAVGAEIQDSGNTLSAAVSQGQGSPSATAQTGDTPLCAVVALLVLAVAAVMALVFSRTKIWGVKRVRR